MNYRRAAIYSRVVFFCSQHLQAKILCRQLPTRGLELIVGGLPSTGSYLALQDGFRLAVLVVLDCVGWSSLYSECHMWLLPHGSWRLTAHSWQQPSCVPLNETSQDKSSTPPELADVPSAARSQSFWFPRWVDPDMMSAHSSGADCATRWQPVIPWTKLLVLWDTQRMRKALAEVLFIDKNGLVIIRKLKKLAANQQQMLNYYYKRLYCHYPTKLA